MEERRLGRTGHNASIITFGGFAVGFDITQKEADAAIEAALKAGRDKWIAMFKEKQTELRTETGEFNK